MLVTECWDVIPGGGRGLLFSIVERPYGPALRSEMTDIPLGVLVRVLAELAEKGISDCHASAALAGYGG